MQMYRILFFHGNLFFYRDVQATWSDFGVWFEQLTCMRVACHFFAEVIEEPTVRDSVNAASGR